jgi:hypothetical protein
VLKQFGEAIEACHDADGLIIDLRGNPGGIGAMSFAIGGWLVIPDVETTWTRADLLEGRDPAVEAAVRWIRSSKK